MMAMLTRRDAYVAVVLPLLGRRGTAGAAVRMALEAITSPRARPTATPRANSPPQASVVTQVC